MVNGHGYKEVLYSEYCSKCRYVETSDTEDPCNECLREFMQLDSHKPMNFKDKES